MGMELLRSQLADCYIKNLSFEQALLEFPQANLELYEQISQEIEAKLSFSEMQLVPSDYYKGIGIEAESHSNGLIVTDIYKACPANALMLKVGDIITKVNFERLTDMTLQNALNKIRNSEYEEGIILEVLRAGEIVTLGYDSNVQPIFIDAKCKYPLNFTALTLGKRIKMLASNQNSAIPAMQLSMTGRSF